MKKSTKGLKLQRVLFAESHSQPYPESLLPPLFDDAIEEHDEGLKAQETKRNKVVCRTQADQIWTCLSNGTPAPSGYEKHKPFWSSWMKIGNMKPWLGGDLLLKISRGSTEKRKEELRLHMAQVQATLSVAELAAAVAGIVANSSLEEPNNCVTENMTNGDGWDRKMNTVVASAATLVATVCAEAAESLGANRALIASVINSGLATQTPANILTLTATAATCLRGHAALKQRTTTSHYISQYQEMLARGSELPISTQLGKIQLRMVWVYLEHGKLKLKIGKKYLQGALTTYKEYRIIYSMEGANEGGFTKGTHAFLLNLGTTGGSIQVLFEDEKQYMVWKSTISNLLPNYLG